MEAILLSPNPDHQTKNCNYYRGGFISRSTPPSSNIHGGGGILVGSPPYIYSSSFPSSISILGHHHHHHHQQQQPPLLPLPVPSRNNKPILQFSPTSNNRKSKNRTREQQDLAPKKSKSSINHISRTDSRSKNKSRGTTTLLISSTRLGPEPRDIPKEVSGVLKPVVTSTEVDVVEEEEEEEELSVSGSIFSLAPPPSSLPLPKFSVTPRLMKCNVEAGGNIDAGATDDLRRLLRLGR